MVSDIKTWIPEKYQKNNSTAQSSEISSWFNLQITEVTVGLTRSHFSKEKLSHFILCSQSNVKLYKWGCRVVKLHHQLCLIPRIIFGTIRVESRRHAPDPRAAGVVEEVADSMMAGMTALCVTEFPDPLLSSLSSRHRSLAPPGERRLWRSAERGHWTVSGAAWTLASGHWG